MTHAKAGQYWERLDHLRGIGAFMVFAWHFTHVRGAAPAIEPSLLSIFEEGHTAVSLFMVLSGYLFAKIVRDRRIDFARFALVRALRLGPMLLIGLAIAYAGRPDKWSEIPLGLVWPTWDNGCWSVATELQFYVLLPALLFAFRRSATATALAVLGLAAAGRWAIHAAGGDVQFFAYYSLLGRIDQFVLGILTWRLVQGREVPLTLFAFGFGGFLVALHGVNEAGGFVGTAGSPLWIWWPAVEALAYALLVAWYDGGRWSLPRPVGSPLAFVGRVSYAVYILQFLFFRDMADFAVRVLHAEGFYQLLLLSIPAFLMILPVAWLGWRFIETPVQRWRRPYLLDANDASVKAASGEAA